MSNLFDNRCYGIIIVKSKNSNFNADFSGLPRRLPDKNGTIYATDKALKYAIRRYWVDNYEEDETVFVWKEFKKKSKNKDEKSGPLTLDERYESILEKFKLDKKNPQPIEVLQKCLDVRCFGITFAAKGHNISLCGPVQISYGINRFQGENTVYSSQILSPYAREGEEGESKGQSSIGSESKGLESHYVFDFVINPRNLTDHYADLKKDIGGLTSDDVNKLKEAFCKGVTNLNSTTKIGSENELLLFIALKEDSKIQLPTVKDLVNISKKEEDKYLVDLSRVFEALNIKDQDIQEYDLNLSPCATNKEKENKKLDKNNRKTSFDKGKDVESVEFYYNKSLTEISK